MRRVASGTWVAVFVAAAVGCSPRADDRWLRSRPPTFPAGGRVTLDGEPVAGAVVVFVSADRPLAATGRTDARGRFELKSFAAGDGAVAGGHRVGIEKVTERFVSRPGAEEGAVDVEVVHHLPARYAAPETSGLTAEVRPGTRNVFVFTLQSDSGAPRAPGAGQSPLDRVPTTAITTSSSTSVRPPR